MIKEYKCPYCGLKLAMNSVKRTARHDPPVCDRFVELVKEVAPNTYARSRTQLEGSRVS